MKSLLSMTSRGQITLPKEWRERFKGDYFKAEIQDDQIILRPAESPSEVVFYEDDDGFGLYAEKGLPTQDIIQKIKKLNESNR